MSIANLQDTPVSLYQLLDPEVLSHPYPLYHRLRERGPVQWDPYLHTWLLPDSILSGFTPLDVEPQRRNNWKTLVYPISHL